MELLRNFLLSLDHIMMITENTGLLNRLNKDQMPLLIAEGHLTQLPKNENKELIDDISTYRFPEKIEVKES